MQDISADIMLKEWTGKKTRSVYCLTGEERVFKDEALKKLLSSFKADAFNFSEYDGETADISDLISTAMTPSFTDDTRVILFKGAEKIKKEAAERLAVYLATPSSATTLILLLDKKTDSAELLMSSLPPEAAAIHFAPLEAQQAALFAQNMLSKEGLSASQEALELIAELANFDAMTIKQETAKLSAWRHGGTNTLEPEDIMESAGFSKTVNPFALSNAISAKDGHKAAEIAEAMLQDGVEAVGMVISIAYIVEKLLKVKAASAGSSGDSAAYSLGLNPGYYRRILESSRSFTQEKLLRSLTLCLEAEAMLKSSSGRDPKLLVKQLIFEVTR